MHFTPWLRSLFMLMATGFALCAEAGTRETVMPAFEFDPPAITIIFPAIVSPALDSVQPKWESAGGLGGGVYSRRCWCRCGVSNFTFVSPVREAKLVDPVAAVGAAYLKSRSVKAVLFDREVPVAHYPEGHFGSWVQAGMLVLEQAEFTDETEIRQVFALLAEAIGESDEAVEWWLYEPGPKLSANDYRRHTGFVPELTFEFTGAVPLRVEISPKCQRMLVQAGDRWDVYAIDRLSVAALKDLLTAKRPRSF
jgi:hypothetical protein